MIGTAMALMLLGLPVAFAFITTNIVGAFIFMGGERGLEQVVSNMSASISVFILVPVPLFILMGDLMVHTGLAGKMMDGFDKLIGRVPGRLCYVSVGAGTVFGALSGSAMASTAMLGSTLVPEMMRRGYKKHMAMGPILGAGGLDILIPPSALAVLLGSIAGIDIGRLLIAGIVPALILAVMYVGVIALQLKIDPSGAPPYDMTPIPWREKLKSAFVNLAPLSLVIFCVCGLIIMGIATPTESAAFGVLSILVLAAAFRCLSWDAIRRSLESTMRVSVMLFTIILGSITFSQVLAFSGASSGLVSWALGFQLAPTALLALMLAVVIFLGLFIDEVSQIMLTVPIYMPVVKAVSLDPIWFGTLMMICMVIGALSPPFGLQLFVMMGVGPKGTTLGEVAWAAVPYMTCQTILVALIIAFPIIATWLPAITQ
ncbi:MAG TPA: TRAP transporter large permease [Anaerolineales bacterium]|jgi:tripartite ATP-independent transporter DctM subunit